MSRQSKGKCKFCGKEYTKASMVKHISVCKERIKKETEIETVKTIGYFEILIAGKHAKNYWLLTEFREDATLKDLDKFIRDIWVECCGHLSSFKIDEVWYESDSEPSMGWGRRTIKDMNCKLKDVIVKGMSFDYEYDYGSTTALTISITNYMTGNWKKEKLIILSRNNPIEFICDECGEEIATCACEECMYEGVGFLCNNCNKNHECGEEMLMDICNSPRFGVCGYSGSTKYPD